MKGFPENIDDIESFYQGELHDDAMEPPAGLWESIAAQLPPPPVPPMPPVSSFLGVTAKTWFVSSVITASLVGFYVSYKTEVENKVISSENKEIESTRRDTLIENQESVQLPSISNPSQGVTNTPDIQVNTNTSNKISTSDLPISNSQNTESELAPANTEETLEGTKVDPIAEEENSNKDNVQLELVSPKMHENPGVKGESKDHHKSFFDKKTAQLKDSARPLFVPKKK